MQKETDTKYGIRRETKKKGGENEKNYLVKNDKQIETNINLLKTKGGVHAARLIRLWI
jgi:hypothetical protein